MVRVFLRVRRDREMRDEKMQKQKEQTLAPTFLKVLIFALPSIPPHLSNLNILSSPLQDASNHHPTPPLNPPPQQQNISNYHISNTHPSIHSPLLIPHSSLPTPHSPTPSPSPPQPLSPPSPTIPKHTSATRENIYLGTHIITSLNQISISPPFLLTCS